MRTYACILETHASLCVACIGCDVQGVYAAWDTHRILHLGVASGRWQASVHMQFSGSSSSSNLIGMGLLLNDMTPADITSGSNKVVWWKNDVRGSWQQRISGRIYSRRKINGELASVAAVVVVIVGCWCCCCMWLLSWTLCLCSHHPLEHFSCFCWRQECADTLWSLFLRLHYCHAKLHDAEWHAPPGSCGSLWCAFAGEHSNHFTLHWTSMSRITSPNASFDAKCKSRDAF